MKHSSTGVLCNSKIPTKVTSKLYRTSLRPTMSYGSEWWTAKVQHIYKMNVAKMQMLRWMCGHTKLDNIRNGHILQHVQVVLKDLQMVGINVDLAKDRTKWEKKIHIGGGLRIDFRLVRELPILLSLFLTYPSLLFYLVDDDTTWA